MLPTHQSEPPIAKFHPCCSRVVSKNRGVSFHGELNPQEVVGALRAQRGRWASCPGADLLKQSFTVQLCFLLRTSSDIPC